jgi:hypothetical protein
MELLVRRAGSQDDEKPGVPRMHRIHANADMTVSSLKDVVAARTGYEYAELILMYSGTVLPNHARLSQCGLVDQACVLLFRKAGRGKQASAQSPAEEAVASSSSSSSSSSSLSASPSPSSPVTAASQSFNAQLGLISQRMRTIISPQVMQPLLEMGFTEARTVKALLLNLLNTEMAMEWLLEHADDPDIDEPLTRAQVLQVSHSIQLVQPAVRSIPEAIEEAIAQLQCTYRITGSQYSPQQYHYCYTCNLVDGRGCCLACARVCHAGHQLSAPIHSDSFYCDCGSNDGPNQCQAMLDAPGQEVAVGVAGVAGLEAVIAEGDGAGEGVADSEVEDLAISDLKIADSEVVVSSQQKPRLMRRGGGGVGSDLWREQATTEYLDPASTFEQQDFVCVVLPLYDVNLAAREDLQALLRACEDSAVEVSDRQLTLLDSVAQDAKADPAAVLRLLAVAVLHPQVANHFATQSPVALIKVACERLGAARQAAELCNDKKALEECLVGFLSLMVNVTSRAGSSPLMHDGLVPALEASRGAWRPWKGRIVGDIDVRELGGAFMANLCLIIAHGVLPGKGDELVRHLLRVLRGAHHDELAEAEATCSLLRAITSLLFMNKSLCDTVFDEGGKEVIELLLSVETAGVGKCAHSLLNILIS